MTLLSLRLAVVVSVLLALNYKVESFSVAPAVVSKSTLASSRHATTIPLFVASSIDPEDEMASPLEAAAEVVEDVSAPKAEESSTGTSTTFDNIVMANLIPISVGLLALIVGVQFASSIMEFLANETVKEATNLASNLGVLLGAIAGIVFEFLKFLVPAIGKGVYMGVQAAAPVVGQAAQDFGEAASPYLQDATHTVQEAAAPVLDNVQHVVDESVVTPLKTATDSMGATIQTTIDESITSIQDSVSNAVDTTIVAPVKDATDSMSKILIDSFHGGN